MKRYLIVAATYTEVKELILKFHLKKTGNNTYEKNQLSVIITGVGVHATIFELSRFLQIENFSLIINCGIAGSFPLTAKVNDIFLINSDYYADCGFYKNGEFVNLYDSDFNKSMSQVFVKGKLYIDDSIPEYFKSIKSVAAVTVNIPEIIPQPNNTVLESMEGAAVMMCAKLKNITCLQIRAVSNIIGITPRQQWSIDYAIKQYSEFISVFLLNENVL